MKPLTIATIIFWIILTPLLSQEQDKYFKTRESIAVTHVEVPVRVFFRGKPVDHLAKTDFKLYEAKTLQTIQGFYIKRKKLHSALDPRKLLNKRALSSSRYFVLVFRIFDYHQEFQKGVNFVFERILRENDQVLLFCNDKTLYFDNLKNKEEKLKLLHQCLEKESRKARNLLSLYCQKVKDQLNSAKLELAFDDGPFELGRILDNFLNKYLLLWKEYKRRYLLPDLNKYYNFARHLEKIKREKWVINFYQIELFPKLKFSGRMRKQIEDFIIALLSSRPEDQVMGRILNELLSQVDRELALAQDFPAEEVSKLFYKVDTTFHSIFMNTTEKDAGEDLDMKRVATDLENSLREITEKTGGELIATTDLRNALDTVCRKEDVYYMLTYRPDNPDKVGKIKVEVDNDQFQIIYDNNMRADYIREYLDRRRAETPSVQIDRAGFEGKKLNLTLSNFFMKGEPSEMRGRIMVGIRIKDSQNRTLFHQNKTVTARKDSIRLTIDFKWLKKGQYDVFVDVKDLLTDKETMNFLQPVID